MTSFLPRPRADRRLGRIGIVGVRSAPRRLHRKRMVEECAARPGAGAAHRRLSRRGPAASCRAIWRGCARPRRAAASCRPTGSSSLSRARPLAAARFDAVAASLLPYAHRRRAPAPGLGAPPGTAVIRRERYLVTLPPCPDWSKPAAGAGDFTNTASSNFGCATAVNLGLTVAQPADLVEARPVGLTGAVPPRDGRGQLPNGKVVLPAAAHIGPIAAAVFQPAARRRGRRRGTGTARSHDSSGRHNRARPRDDGPIAPGSSRSCRTSRRSSASATCSRTCRSATNCSSNRRSTRRFAEYARAPRRAFC